MASAETMSRASSGLFQAHGAVFADRSRQRRQPPAPNAAPAQWPSRSAPLEPLQGNWFAPFAAKQKKVVRVVRAVRG